MPSKKVLTPILGGNYYHLFNRGINKQPVFLIHEDYFFFLSLLDRFLLNYCSILAYSLVPNHFHLVIKVHEEIKLNGIPSQGQDGILTDEVEVGKIVSNQLRRVFITYSMLINRRENRTGSLWDKNFKRLEIMDHEYLMYLIYYTHYNPEKHGFILRFDEYQFSSYKALARDAKTKIDKGLVYDIYGGKDEFFEFHNSVRPEFELAGME